MVKNTDYKRLSCKICQHKSDDLVSHIMSAHVDLGINADDALAKYMIKFLCDDKDVIHPDIGKEPTVETSVDIKGVKMPLGRGGPFVPSVNEAYHFSDVAADIANDIKENKKVLNIGHCGTGKTSMFEQIAARCNQGAVRVNMNSQTTIGDFVGLWTVKGGETVWVDGVLPMAMRHGLWLTIDELDFAEPAILSVLNSVLEKNGKLTLKEKGHEIIVPHEDFRLFGTSNAAGCMARFRGLYQGTNIMNEAFLDRWRCYHISYLPPDEEAKVLVATVPRMNSKIATVIVRVGNIIREAFLKEEISCTFSLRRMIDWAELMVRHKDPLKAAAPSIFAKVSPEDSSVIEGIIKRVMIGTPTA